MLPRPLKGNLGGIGLPKNFAIQQKRRVAPEHQPVDLTGASGPVPPHNIFRLEPAEVLDKLGRTEGPPQLLLAGLYLGLLVDLRRETQRFNACPAQHGETGGRGRGKYQAHT